MSDPETPRTKWNRSQRFQLSLAGRRAAQELGRLVVASRVESGRKSFDAAQAGWAARTGLAPTDGIYLNELLQAPRSISEIALSLDGCGPQIKDVRTALERLVQAGMMELVAMPPPRR